MVAGVLVAEDRIERLASFGVRDSKQLSPSRRRKLAETICNFADRVLVNWAQPFEIDDAVRTKIRLRRLNYLEAKLMAQLAARLTPFTLYLDAADTIEKRFGETVRSLLPEQMRGMKIVSKHHADQMYPTVSAASIVAKVERDRMIEELRSFYGDFGSGYPSDPKTVAFLKLWKRDEGDYPLIVRRT